MRLLTEGNIVRWPLLCFVTLLAACSDPHNTPIPKDFANIESAQLDCTQRSFKHFRTPSQSALLLQAIPSVK